MLYIKHTSKQRVALNKVMLIAPNSHVNDVIFSLPLCFDSHDQNGLRMHLTWLRVSLKKTLNTHFNNVFIFRKFSIAIEDGLRVCCSKSNCPNLELCFKTYLDRPNMT